MVRPIPGLALGTALLACVLQPSLTLCQEAGDRPNQSSPLWIHAYVISPKTDGDTTNIQELQNNLRVATDEAVEEFAIPFLLQRRELILAYEKRKQVQDELETLGWTWSEDGGIAYRSRDPVTDSDLQAVAEVLHPQFQSALSLPAKSPVTDKGLAPLLAGQFSPLTSLSVPFSKIGDDSLRRLVKNHSIPAGGSFLHDLQEALHPDQALWLFLTRAGEQPNLVSTWVGSLQMKKLSVTRACGSTGSEVPSAIDFVLQHAKRNPKMLPGLFSKKSPNILVHRVLTGSGPSQLHSFPIQRLNLAGTNVTDVGLRYMAKLDGVRDLDLSYTKITDAGVEALDGLELRSLKLRDTPITDASIGTLLRMRSLVILDLINTNVTAEGVARLSAASSLKALGMGGPNLSTEQAITVYESMPGLEAIGLPVPAHTLDPTLLANRLPAVFSHHVGAGHLLARRTSRTISGGEADVFTSVQSLAISQDEQRLSVLTKSSGSVGNPWAVHCVDLSTSKISRVQFPDSRTPNRFRRPRFSPDGSLVAITYFAPKEAPQAQDAAPAQTLSVWRLPQKGEIEATLAGSRNVPESTRYLGFTRNNQRLAIATQGSIEMLEVGNQLKTVDKWQTESIQKAITLSPLTEFAISPSGRFIAGASSNKGLLLIDLQDETVKTVVASAHHVIPSLPRFFRRMRISISSRENTCYFQPDESKLYANVEITGGNRPKRMVIYDLEANRITASLAFKTFAGVSAAGDWCITSDANNTFHWGLRGGVPLGFAFVQARSGANSIVLSGGKTVSVWPGKERLRIDVHELAK